MMSTPLILAIDHVSNEHRMVSVNDFFRVTELARWSLLSVIASADGASPAPGLRR